MQARTMLRPLCSLWLLAVVLLEWTAADDSIFCDRPANMELCCKSSFFVDTCISNPSNEQNRIEYLTSPEEKKEGGVCVREKSKKRYIPNELTCCST